jgi:hypothetical protein
MMSQYQQDYNGNYSNVSHPPMKLPIVLQVTATWLRTHKPRIFRVFRSALLALSISITRTPRWYSGYALPRLRRLYKDLLASRKSVPHRLG